MKQLIEALVHIQTTLKAPKDQKSQRYNYRNIEDINEAVKPLAAERGCVVVYTDEVREVLGRLYTVSTCTLTNGDDTISAVGNALMTADPKNMSVEQSSGAASSYARKYAAQGLFAIDSSEDDPDRRPVEGKPAGRAAQTAKRILAEACERKARRFGEDPMDVMREVAKDRPAQPSKLDDWYVKKAAELDRMEPPMVDDPEGYMAELYGEEVAF